MKQDYTNNQEFPEGTFDIKIILYLLKRYWYIVAIGMAVSLIAPPIINKYLDPIYKAQLKILLIDNLSLQTEIFLNEFNFLTHEKKLDLEIEKINSGSIVSEVVNSMEFAVSYFVSAGLKDKEIYKDDFPFMVKTDSSGLRFLKIPFFIKEVNADTCLLTANGVNVAVYDPQRNRVQLQTLPKVTIQQKIAFGQEFMSDGLHLTIFRRNDSTVRHGASGPYFFKMNDPNVLANECMASLNVEPTDKKSSILIITKKGRIVEKEIAFLNKLADIYMENDKKEQQQIAISAIQYLDRQIAKSEGKKDRILDSLNNFIVRNRILDFESTFNNLNQKKEGLEIQKLEIEEALEKYTNLINYMSGISYRKKTVSPSLVKINDPQLNSLMAKLSVIIEQDAEIQFFSEKKLPQFEFNKAKFNALKDAIIENLNNAVISFSASLNRIEENLKETNTRIFQLAERGSEYNKIKQRLDIEKVRCQYFIEKRMEADIAQSSKNSVFDDKMILERAGQSSVEQVFPQKNLTYIITVLLGMGSSMVLIYFIYLLKNTIISKEDVERITSIPVIGSIGHNKHPEEMILKGNKQDLIVESYRKIKANLHYLLNGKGTGILAVTSSFIGEGKTFTALHLSRVYAFSGKKTIIVETDLRRPKIKAIFQSDSDKGLSNYLINNATEDEIIQWSKIDHLFYIHSGPMPPNPNELLNNGLLAKLINHLLERFDYIIIDTPPLGLVADFFSVLDFTDVCLYLVRRDITKRNMLLSLNKYYNEKQIKNIQIVLNDFTDETSKYGYYKR